MRKIIVSTYATLDGVIKDPQDWFFPYASEEGADFASQQLWDADTLLLGRETYQSFADVWPERSGDPFADRINRMTKYVVSSTLREPLAWRNSTLLRGDVVEAATALKEQPGQNILMYGTGPLAHTLLQHGLIDEHWLWVAPLVLGRGTRAFEGLENVKMELVATKTLSTGTVLLCHKPAPQQA